MGEHFVSAAIQPDTGTIDTARMASGEPGLPMVFHWGKRTLRIARVVRSWRESGPCHHGSGELYVRKHWFEVVTDTGQVAKLYFERQPKPGKKSARWWLFTLRDG